MSEMISILILLHCTTFSEHVCRFGLDPNNFVPKTSVNDIGELCYQCLDGLVNNYTETVIEILRCNMDIKFIGSGLSAKAILYYMTDYISKTQLKMHVVYNALEIAIQNYKIHLLSHHLTLNTQS